MSTKSGKMVRGCQMMANHSERRGERGGVTGRGHKDDMSTKSGKLGREGLGWHKGCQEVANHSEGLGGGGRVTERSVGRRSGEGEDDPETNPF